MAERCPRLREHACFIAGRAATGHPEFQQGIEQHREATKHHKKIVEDCLSKPGESPSGMKDMMAKAGRMMQGMRRGAAGDTLVKASLQDYSAEHMEIASQLEIILEDEMRMADWLSSQLPMVVRAELHNAGESDQMSATEYAIVRQAERPRL